MIYLCTSSITVNVRMLFSKNKHCKYQTWYLWPKSSKLNRNASVESFIWFKIIPSKTLDMCDSLFFWKLGFLKLRKFSIKFKCRTLQLILRERLKELCLEVDICPILFGKNQERHVTQNYPFLKALFYKWLFYNDTFTNFYELHCDISLITHTLLQNSIFCFRNNPP